MVTYLQILALASGVLFVVAGLAGIAVGQIYFALLFLFGLFLLIAGLYSVRKYPSQPKKSP